MFPAATGTRPAMEVLARNRSARRHNRRDQLLLKLPARPESLAVARREVGELGQTLGLSGSRLDDLRTLVTEACANAVTHAYAGRDGMMRLRALRRGDQLVISVTDDGDGFRPRPASEGSSGRLGLVLMAALASKIEISKRPYGGTRMRLRFPLTNEAALT
jgi:serine/threonine-protein kinase RsbW